MVILGSEKIKFINYIIKKKFTRDDLVGNFFSTLKKNKEAIDRVNFSSGPLSGEYEYKLFFNLRAKTFLCQVKGKTYKDIKMIRSILRVIQEKDVSVCIMILDNNIQLKEKLKKVCVVTLLMNEVMNNAVESDRLKRKRIDELQDLIDKSLDDSNKDDFIKYSDELNFLLK